MGVCSNCGHVISSSHLKLYLHVCVCSFRQVSLKDQYEAMFKHFLFKPVYSYRQWTGCYFQAAVLIQHNRNHLHGALLFTKAFYILMFVHFFP